MKIKIVHKGMFVCYTNNKLYDFSAKRTVGVFWHNSAETWVDVHNHADGTVVASLVNYVTGNAKQNRVDAR